MEKTIRAFDFTLLIIQIINMIFWVVVAYLLYKLFKKKK
jgi:heme/copper-type cytochrome/quinol oxidase subunit 2